MAICRVIAQNVQVEYCSRPLFNSWSFGEARERGTISVVEPESVPLRDKPSVPHIQHGIDIVFMGDENGFPDSIAIHNLKFPIRQLIESLGAPRYADAYVSCKASSASASTSARPAARTTGRRSGLHSPEA